MYFSVFSDLLGSYTCECATGFYQNPNSTLPIGQDCLKCCKVWNFGDVKCTFDSEAQSFSYSCDTYNDMVLSKQPGNESWSFLRTYVEVVNPTELDLNADAFAAVVFPHEVSGSPCPTNLESVRVGSYQISCEGMVRHFTLYFKLCFC